MRRTNWKTVSTLITIVAAVGCSDQVNVPTQATASATTDVRFAPVRPTFALNTTASATTSSSFTVGPQGGVFFVGTNAVVFPQGSICEPTTSSYGVSEWDAPCTPLKSRITVQYETTVLDGHTAVDFKTPLRFVPSSNPGNWVWLYMYTPAAVNATDVSAFTILYAPILGGAAYDESLTDPTLRTYVDTRTGISVRRIKHFSGYTSWGGNCDPASPTGCTGSDSGSTTP